MDKRKALEDCAIAVHSIRWGETLGIDRGACLPIAYFGTYFLRASNIDARVVEAGARFTDPLSVRYAEIGTIEPGLEARDEKGLPFLGHCAIQLPTQRLIVDMSLPTQGTATLRNLGAPVILAGNLDHTLKHVGFKVAIGRGEAIYRIYPKRDGWSKRDWPWQTLREMALDARLQRGDFAFLKGVEW